MISENVGSHTKPSEIIKREDDKTEYDTILPQEVWQHIFSYLNLNSLFNVRKVCHLFRQLGQDRLLCNKIFQEYFPHLAPEFVNTQLLKTAPESLTLPEYFLKKLNLETIKAIPTGTLKDIDKPYDFVSKSPTVVHGCVQNTKIPFMAFQFLNYIPFRENPETLQITIFYDSLFKKWAGSIYFIHSDINQNGKTEILFYQHWKYFKRLIMRESCSFFKMSDAAGELGRESFKESPDEKNNIAYLERPLFFETP